MLRLSLGCRVTASIVKPETNPGCLFGGLFEYVTTTLTPDLDNEAATCKYYASSADTFFRK